MLFRSESVHFWYVRTLIICFVVAPLVAYAARRIWVSVLLMLAVLLIQSGSWAALAHVPVSVTFFLLGTQLARIKHEKLSQWRLEGMIVCMIGLVLSFLLRGQITEHYFTVLFEPLFMIGVLWFGYDVVDATLNIGKFPKGLNVLFIVYCMHLIVLCWCGGIMRLTLGINPAARLIGYFSLWLTFWLDVWLANLIKRRLCGIYKLLSGGR